MYCDDSGYFAVNMGKRDFIGLLSSERLMCPLEFDSPFTLGFPGLSDLVGGCDKYRKKKIKDDWIVCGGSHADTQHQSNEHLPGLFLRSCYCCNAVRTCVIGQRQGGSDMRIGSCLRGTSQKQKPTTKFLQTKWGKSALEI